MNNGINMEILSVIRLLIANHNHALLYFFAFGAPTSTAMSPSLFGFFFPAGPCLNSPAPGVGC